MGFHPTSDVVLDVIKAADPTRAGVAAERLASLAAGAPAGDFALDLDRAAAAQTADKAQGAPGLADARATVWAQAPDSASAKVAFEAMAIDGFVRDMLPKDSPSFFGQGAAGDIWRSMLSEQISRQIAKSGALGLSRRLFATHEIATSGGARDAAAATAGTSANILSTPAAAEIADGAILTARRRG